MSEAYDIRYTYQKPDGYWETKTVTKIGSVKGQHEKIKVEFLEEMKKAGIKIGRIIQISCQ